MKLDLKFLTHIELMSLVLLIFLYILFFTVIASNAFCNYLR